MIAGLARQRIGNVLLVAIRLGQPQFVQDSGRKSGEQLRARDISPIAKVGSRVERIDSTYLGVERIVIAKVIQPHKELLLLRDLPIRAHIDELRVLYRRSGREQTGRQTDQSRIVRD